MVANKHFDLAVKSPGRINLIGEHIDYNGGHVLPAAINLNIIIRFKKKEGNVCHVSSKEKNGFKFNIHQTLKPKSNNCIFMTLDLLGALVKKNIDLFSFFKLFNVSFTF